MKRTEKKMLKKMEKMDKTNKLTLELNMPIKIEESNLYLLIIRDAKDINHYFKKDGSYDGYCRPCNV